MVGVICISTLPTQHTTLKYDKYCFEFFWEFDVSSCMLMRKISKFSFFEGKLEIKSPGENKINRGNHGITNKNINAHNTFVTYCYVLT